MLRPIFKVTPTIVRLDFVNASDREKAIRDYAQLIREYGSATSGKEPLVYIYSNNKGYELRFYAYSKRGWKYYLVSRYSLNSYNEPA